MPCGNCYLEVGTNVGEFAVKKNPGWVGVIRFFQNFAPNFEGTASYFGVGKLFLLMVNRGVYKHVVYKGPRLLVGVIV